MSDFITLERSSSEFNKYLHGEVSLSMRAIPVRSLNINKSNEKVTFQMVCTTEIKSPALAKILARVFRFDLLTLTIMPGLVTACLLADRLSNWAAVGLALLSLFFLHGGLFCRNDYLDHVRGVDRLNEKGGSRVIQKGWLRAIAVKRIAHVMFFASVATAIPVVLAQPEFLKLRDLPVPIYLMGLYFALLTWVYVLVRQIISMLVDDEAGLSTVPVRLGFDRAHKLVMGLLFISAVILFSYFTYQKLNAVSIFLALPIACYILWLSAKASAITSPLSSSLYALPQKIIRLHFYSGLYIVLMSWV